MEKITALTPFKKILDYNPSLEFKNWSLNTLVLSVLELVLHCILK